ncbi:hypothetical protein [Bacillus sp. NEAU-Y102]
MLTIKTKKAVNRLVESIKECVRKEQELTDTFGKETNVYESAVQGMADAVYLLLGMVGEPFRVHSVRDCTGFKLVVEGGLLWEHMPSYQKDFDAVAKVYKAGELSLDVLCDKHDEIDKRYGVVPVLYRKKLPVYMR